MRNRIKTFFLYLLFWYIVFIAARVLFLDVYYQKTVQLSVPEILETFFYGLKLDVSTAAYFAFIPALILSFSALFSIKKTSKFYLIYTAIVAIGVAPIIIGDLFLYKYWGFRMDATPLFYLSNPKAAAASASWLENISGALCMIAFAFAIIKLFKLLLNKYLSSLTRSIPAFFIVLVLTLLLPILMRGGLGRSPLNTSSAYFSKKQFANHAAINPVWNVFYSLTEKSNLEKKYEYFAKQNADKAFYELYDINSDTTCLLNTRKPNIILIITESLTAKALAYSGADSAIMPNLNSLVQQGILFSNIYAASDRTDKGLAAVLAAYPSLPGSSPLKFPSLTENLSFLPKTLNQNGYNSSFYYGGTLEFANYRSFLIQAGFNKMLSDKDFPSSELKTKWGAYDATVFKKLLDDTPNGETAFFKTVLTLTSHEPFSIPIQPYLKGNSEEIKYLNSLHYTDQTIGEFVNEAKKRDWWKNTLVIIVADHGSRMPGNSEEIDPTKYHIPIIWLGGALKTRGMVIATIGSQTDLAATLLQQLSINAHNFKFSRNIIGYKNPFAFFTFNDGVGLMLPNGHLIYNTVSGQYIHDPAQNKEQNKQKAKAWLQVLYEDTYRKINALGK